MDKLKACPHCGETEGVTLSETNTGFVLVHWWQVECHGCCASIVQNTEAEAIAAWNTRTPAPAPVGGDVVEALKDVLASLVAAHSLLSRSPKTAAPSDKMFDQMLKDYEKSIERGRKAYTALQAQPAPAQGDDVLENLLGDMFEDASVDDLEGVEAFNAAQKTQTWWGDDKRKIRVPDALLAERQKGGEA